MCSPLPSDMWRDCFLTVVPRSPSTILSNEPQKSDLIVKSFLLLTVSESSKAQAHSPDAVRGS